MMIPNQPNSTSQRYLLGIIAVLGLMAVLVLPYFDDAHAQELSFEMNNRVFVDGQAMEISGQASSEGNVIVRLQGPDETIKVFESVTADGNGFFDYEFVWPEVTREYQYGIYVVDVMDITQKEEPVKIEILYTSSFKAKKYSDFAKPVNCGFEIKLLSKECAISFHHKEDFSPLKQFESGIYHSEIRCKDGLKLVMKSSNSFPACVKPDTIPKLVERGWMNSEYANNIHETERDRDINYYNSYGLRVNYIEIRDASDDDTGPKRDGKPVTKIDSNLVYDIVSVIQNRDGFEKDFVARMSIEHPNGESSESTDSMIIPPHGTRVFYLDWVNMHPGKSDVDIYLSENRSTIGNDAPFSKSFFFE